MHTWHITASRTVVHDRWIHLRADSCVTPSGHTITPYYVLGYPDWVNCLVVDGNGDVVMVRHYRHGIGGSVLELVGGAVEQTDSSPRAAMWRELVEEIGYTGGQLYQTGVCFPNPANQANRAYSFIAVGGTCDVQPRLEVGEDLHVEKVPFVEFVEVFGQGHETYQALHLANVSLALQFLRRTEVVALHGLKELL